MSASPHSAHTDLLLCSRIAQARFGVVLYVTLYAELWSSVNWGPVAHHHAIQCRFAVAWKVRPNFQLDVGANFGLNRNTPVVQLYVGAGQWF
jgi:hypothetical protein